MAKEKKVEEVEKPKKEAKPKVVKPVEAEGVLPTPEQKNEALEEADRIKQLIKEGKLKKIDTTGMNPDDLAKLPKVTLEEAIAKIDPKASIEPEPIIIPAPVIMESVPTMEEAIERIKKNPQPEPEPEVTFTTTPAPEPVTIELKPEIIDGKEMPGFLYPIDEALQKIETKLEGTIEGLSFQAKKWFDYLKYQRVSPEKFLEKYPTHKFREYIEEIMAKVKKL